MVNVYRIQHTAQIKIQCKNPLKTNIYKHSAIVRIYLINGQYEVKPIYLSILNRNKLKSFSSSIFTIAQHIYTLALQFNQHIKIYTVMCIFPFK